MPYTVKEIFYTLQGEGFHAGRAAVFLRFAGCNLWSGREQDRATAQCRFCDTDFIGGTKYHDARSLADAVAACATPGLVVCTGGEPLLQLDAALCRELAARGFAIAVETNGTLPVPVGVDWVCVSPKAGAPLAIRSAEELKLVFPQEGAQPEAWATFPARHRWLQPMDGPLRKTNTDLTIAYCLANPAWRLSLQTHKIAGIR